MNAGICVCLISTSVRSGAITVNVEVVATPVLASVHARRSGGSTSLNTALMVYRLPSASLTIVVTKSPPGRRSTVMPSTGVLIPVGPQNCARCSGRVMHRKTTARGASKTRVITSSASSVMGLLRIGIGRLRTEAA